jgi:osmoprotectant transport system permease protein
VMLAQTSGQPLILLWWVGENTSEIASRGVQHLWLTVASVSLGLVIAFPLAVLAHRHHRALAPVTWVAGLLYTIPSLALISLLVTITGFSYVTVIIPLTSYTLLILIRNIVAGLDGVPADAKEAALGMGFTPTQLLWRVEIPLAMPVIIAGPRIATVSTIGLVTIAALIGRGGFGQFILLGLNEFFWTPLLVGVILSVVLAVLADLALLAVQRAVTPWARIAGVRAVAT